MEAEMGKQHRNYETWQELIEDKTRREGDCLIWEAGTHSQGYPMVRWELTMVQVVRKQVEEATSQKLDGRNQRVKNRSCGNLLCVNPDHYIIADYGTEEWNCVNHLVYSKEEKDDMYEIYKNHLATNPTKYGYQNAILKKYPNVSRTTIGKIIKKYNKNT